MDNRFLLQRLPIVAIEEVFKLMNPFEIMQFARISKKSKRLVQFVAKFSRFKTSLFIDDEIIFLIHIGDDFVSFRYKMKSDRKAIGTVRYIESEDMYVQSEYSKGLEKIKKIVNFTNECLNLQMDRFVFNLNQFSKKNREIINWVKSLYPSSMQSITLHGKDVSHHEVNYCLAELSTKNLTIGVETKNNQPVIVPKSLDYLQIWSAKWVTLQHLLEFDTELLKIWDGTLQNEELKVLLKKFKNLECHVNLKTFSYQMENLESFDAITEGIDNEFVDPEEWLEIEKHFGVRQPAVNMKLMDGTVATMYSKVIPIGPIFEMRIALVSDR